MDFEASAQRAGPGQRHEVTAGRKAPRTSVIFTLGIWDAVVVIKTVNAALLHSGTSRRSPEQRCAHNLNGLLLGHQHRQKEHSDHNHDPLGCRDEHDISPSHDANSPHITEPHHHVTRPIATAQPPILFCETRDREVYGDGLPGPRQDEAYIGVDAETGLTHGRADDAGEHARPEAGGRSPCKGVGRRCGRTRATAGSSAGWTRAAGR